MISSSQNQQNPQPTGDINSLESANYIAAGDSFIGGRSENQDSFFFYKKNPSLLFVSVCDGMGGMNGGAIASTTAVVSVHEAIMDMKTESMTEDTLRKLIENANAAVYNRAASDPKLMGMGTTITLLVITREAAFLAHVGDSRIYLLRNGKKVYRTFDHSRVFELVDAGVMTEEEARTSNFSNVITRALGIRPNIEATIEKIPYLEGDRFILCCDGIWNCLPEREIIKMMGKYDNPAKEVDYLIKSVNKIGEDNGGGHDNMTVAVIDMKRDSDYQFESEGWIKKLMNKIGLSQNNKN
ncbi:MAG: protein phosphatase 2C domain-containing protein [Muribaculaceae bacterium]|nr:protein phosphatase 2C domain-containing protein [Muribaculaceae bacterium]